MKSAGIFEAKTNFSQFIEQVLCGDSVSITKHGREVARLIPPQTARQGIGIREAVSGIQALQKRLASKVQETDGMSIQEMIAWGRQ